MGPPTFSGPTPDPYGPVDPQISQISVIFIYKILYKPPLNERQLTWNYTKKWKRPGGIGFHWKCPPEWSGGPWTRSGGPGPSGNLRQLRFLPKFAKILKISQKSYNFTKILNILNIVRTRRMFPARPHVTYTYNITYNTRSVVAVCKHYIKLPVINRVHVVCTLNVTMLNICVHVYHV